MSKKDFSKESVEIIYNNAKRIGYNQGFLDGYKRGVKDAKEMVEKLVGVDDE